MKDVKVNPVELARNLRAMPGARVHGFVNDVNSDYQHLQGNARPLSMLAEAFTDPKVILETFNVKARQVGDKVLLEHERLFHNYLATAGSFSAHAHAQLKRLAKQDARWAVLSPHLQRLERASISRYMKQLRDYTMHPQALACLANMQLVPPNDLTLSFTLSAEQIRALGEQTRKPMAKWYWDYAERNRSIIDLVNEHLDQVEAFIGSVTITLNSTFGVEMTAYAEAAEELRELVRRDFPDLE
jgi:hypothetical protein